MSYMKKRKIIITGNRWADAILVVFGAAAVMHVGILAGYTVISKDLSWIDIIRLLDLNLILPKLAGNDLTFWGSGVFWAVLIGWVYTKTGD